MKKSFITSGPSVAGRPLSCNEKDSVALQLSTKISADL